MLSQRGVHWLDELVITNCDEDHASDLPNLVATVPIGILTRNPTITGNDLYLLKARGGIGAGITSLANMTDLFQSPIYVRPNYDGMVFKLFWNSYPDDFQDENNLSLVTVLRWPGTNASPGFTVLFGGDMESEGWMRLLRRPEFIMEMRDINVFVASHHGRSNGYCSELFRLTGLKPDIFVISDSGIQHATQETVAKYSQHAKGYFYNGVLRRVFSTRKDGTMRFDIIGGA